jgi:hypothetical protein
MDRGKEPTPAGKPRTPADTSKSSPKASAKVKPGASEADERATGSPASRLIDQRIRELGGWRGETLARMRALILEADPEMIEEWKWMGTPVWSHHGNVCTGEAYTKVVKLTFVQGASLADPARLFNSSLGGNTRRAIDIHEGEKVDAVAFKALVRAAVARNGPPAKARARARPDAGGAGTAKLLAGGNPQIAKADGDAPVQAYIAAMPGWTRDVGRSIDALITRTVPGVRKAVRWNSPFYGVEGRGWFLGFHVFTRCVRVTFFRGTALRPVPPGGTGRDARWIDIHEDDLDEAQMAAWVMQAAALPGWVP